ncbi:MAG: hypothetical protein FJ297_16805 [Planctomycetes bacterium]|nr:hypothetical protein [Planctomycetota bacterium]
MNNASKRRRSAPSRPFRTRGRFARRIVATAWTACLVAVAGIGRSDCAADELLVGAATIDVTPERPVALWGQLHTRISTGAESPITATVLALESRSNAASAEQCVVVACDVVAIPDAVLEQTRAEVAKRVEGFPVEKIILCATHTHTAPVLLEGIYNIPEAAVMRPTEYVAFLSERIADGIATAWQSRKPGKVGWGLGHAVVGYNRRAVYDDGRAVMYGGTDQPSFRMIEGYEDHGVEVLCFWDGDDRLIATAVNVACPAQEVEGRGVLNADFWHPLRTSLRARHGEGLHVLGLTGGAGDQSPHLMFRKQAEERMMRLRGLNRLTEIARRIETAWNEAYEGARQEKHADVPLVHRIERLELPRREVTEREWRLAKAKVEELRSDPKNSTLVWWHGKVVERYERQQAGTVAPYHMDLHAVRLGDVAVCTNPFELFADYSIQMKARSPALQTFVIQLAGPGSYLPSARAAAGGGYSAIAESNEIGPAGGQILVDRTVDHLRNLWEGSR